MSDRVFFPLAGALAIAMVALALVWPQGFGARSPGPFGRRTAAEAAKVPVLRPTLPVQPQIATPGR